MDIRIVAPSAIGGVGATLVLDGLAAARRSHPTLMAAVGTSPLPIYRELAARRADRRWDPAGTILVQLDEYLGLDPDDERSLLGWLRRDLAEPLGIGRERVIGLDRADTADAAEAADAAAVCRAYDAAVAAAGGIDVAIVGLGPNGHLGFNEPPSAADAPTRPVALTAASLTSNAAYWPGLEVPTHAVTAGMATILAARRILLVVTGAAKRPILRRLLTEPSGPDLPGSLLRAAPGATLLADSAAWPADLRSEAFRSDGARDPAGAGAGA